MTIKIHYTINDYEDCFIVEGETDEDCIKFAHEECEKRNLTTMKNNLWSEKLEV